MPVTFDTRRNKYVARLTHNGVRHYIGAYDSEKVAKVALRVRKEMLENLDASTLEAYEMELEETDSHGTWGEAIGRWLSQRRANKKLEKETEARLRTLEPDTTSALLKK